MSNTRDFARSAGAVTEDRLQHDGAHRCSPAGEQQTMPIKKRGENKNTAHTEK